MLGSLYTINAIAAYFLLMLEMPVEHANIKTYGDAFWVLQMSASTIGFGDFYPVTFGGRLIITLIGFLIGGSLMVGAGGVIFGWVTGRFNQSIKNRELRQQNATIIDLETENGAQMKRANELNEQILAKLNAED